MNIDLLITLTADKSDENNVTIAFFMGKRAAEKGYKVEILLLSNGVHLAEKGYAHTIDIGEPFPPVKQVVDGFIRAGGKIKACSACLIHNHINLENLLEEVEMVDADYVIDAVMVAKKTLQLN